MADETTLRCYGQLDLPDPRAEGLLLVGFADVQMRGLWLNIVAFAPNGESWDSRNAHGASRAQPHRRLFDVTS